MSAGGPYPHRFGPDGRCRVCGYQDTWEGPARGCPYQVADARAAINGARESKALSTAEECAEAMRALRKETAG